MECYWAKQHVSIDSEGVFRPCCTWRNIGDEPVVTKVEDYYQTDFYKKLNETLSKNIWPEGCEDCMEHESVGRVSMRTESNLKAEKYAYLDAEIKFGNLCNLACVMCSPYNSSLIQDEYLKMHGQHHYFNKGRNFKIKNAWYQDEDSIRQIARSLSDRDELQFSGGEPTVNSYLKIFLDELIKCKSNTTLLVRTNANNWPTKMHELLKQFETKISISIDAYGKANEYIRWPSQWNKTERNVNKILSLPNSEIKLNPTVAAYNVHLLPELYEWALSTGIFRFNFDSVYTPKALAANNSENWQKEIYKEFCKKYHRYPQKVLNHVKKEGNGLNEAIDFLKVLDYNRGTNYKVLGI